MRSPKADARHLRTLPRHSRIDDAPQAARFVTPAPYAHAHAAITGIHALTQAVRALFLVGAFMRLLKSAADCC